MSASSMIGRLGAVCGCGAAAGLIALACAGDTPVPTDHGAHLHGQADPLLSAHAPPEVQKTIAELRRWSAPFHNLEKAAEAGYDINIGCIDETTLGVDASIARGMGYHVTGAAWAPDPTAPMNIDQPQFLVYAPHPREAQLPPEDRLKAARLVGFDYFIPGEETDTPPEFFGEPFNWLAAFGGWTRHIYLWGNNPEGMFEDFNANVPLCADPL